MLTIYGTKRIKFGTNASRNLRLRDKFPAIVYCSSKPNLAIELEQYVFLNMEIKKIDLYKTKILLVINDIECIVQIKTIQRHVFKSKILHIDFLRISS
ncbi:MAG: 50S ribosomal protein L25 [Buchnera aphidicola (Chaetogeoica yunlongensis)]